MMKHFTIILAIFIYLFFTGSALKTHTLDYFFPWGNVHEYQGLDFYQVPAGAHAYFAGGSLTGSLPYGANSYAYSNTNVYHPFFTLVIGGFLQLFEPQRAFILWLVIRGIIMMGLAYILYSRYKANKNILLAIFLVLVNFPGYLEMWNGQYQFLLDTSIFFLLLSALKKQDRVRDGLWYAASLFIKPIGILFLVPFALHKRWKTVSLGLGIFSVATLLFLAEGSGAYYVNNLLNRFGSPIGGPPGVFTLDALLRQAGVSALSGAAFKIFSIVMIVVLTIRLRLNLFTSIFLWIAYYLLFYDLVFEYHYTTLAIVLALGVLTQRAFQSRSVKALSLTYLLPTPFFLMHYSQFGAVEQHVTDMGWFVLVLWRIVPLILLIFLVIGYNVRRHT